MPTPTPRTRRRTRPYRWPSEPSRQPGSPGRVGKGRPSTPSPSEGLQTVRPGLCGTWLNHGTMRLPNPTTKESTVDTAIEGEVLSKVIEIGDKLRNGATVLAMKPYTPGNSREGLIVLALSHREFVTWVCESDGSEAFWGHYYGMDLVSALAGFERRS